MARELGKILEPLYAAALEPGLLADFSAALCEATGSHVGAVMAHDAAHARGQLDLLVGADPVHMAAYEQEYAADNPWMRHGQHLMVAGGVMDSDAVLSRAELKRTRYYNEYLRISDVEQSVALCAQADAQGVVVATLCRAGSLPAYSDADMALMRQVAPHWANAYAIQRRLSWLEQRVQTLEAAVEAAPLAMMMLDAGQRVLRMNAAAEQLLSQGDLLCLQRGRPQAYFGGQPLRQALHEAVAGVHVDGSLQRRAAKVILENALGRGALVADVHPLDAGSQPDGTALAILFLQPVGAPAGSDLTKTLQQLFNLTASESTLACALQRHADLPTAAAECGITHGTAQTRLKLIYGKIGERGQTALMRLVAAVAAVTR